MNEYYEKGKRCLTTGCPRTYIIIHVCTCLCFIPTQRQKTSSWHVANKNFLMPHALTSRVARLANRTRLVFRLYSTLKRLLTQMGNGFLLKSHNGAHCCGTVGDSHSHSQLSTAKCTFTGNSSMELRYKGNTFFRTTCIIGDFFVDLQTNGMHRLPGT